MKPTLLLGGIGVALTFLLGYNFIYGPYQRQVGLIRTQLAEEYATQQTQRELAATLQEVEDRRKRLPPEPEPSWLVREVVALSEKAGVQLTTIIQESPIVNDQFTRLGVTLQVSTSYHQLGTFLDELEHSGHFIQVDRIRMNQLGEGGPIAVEVSLSTLYLPAAVTAAQPGAV